MRLQSSCVLLSVLGIAGGGCDGMEASQSPLPPQVLVRRDPLPAGATCKYGGTAVRSGVDTNRNGTLDDVEITQTAYVCDPSTTQLIRRDAVAAGPECPGGGVDIRAGIDDNDNGVLDDAEIEQTTRVCNSLELWEGDFTAADWSDPVKLAALEGARVVTGSLEIATLLPVRLPLLELVGGHLIAVAPTPSVALPALRQVGSLELDLLDVDGPLSALERVNGSLRLSSPGGSAGASVVAPKLREVSGDFFIVDTARGEVSLPALTTVGGDMGDLGGLTSLSLGVLTSIGGRLFPGDTALDPFELPALLTVGGDLMVGASTRRLRLPKLEQIAGRLDIVQHLGPTLRVTEASLPSVTRIGGDVMVQQARALTALDLASLEIVEGIFMLSDAPALVTLNAPHLRTATGIDNPATRRSVAIWSTGLETVELGSLATTVGGISISGNTALRTVSLPSLTSAEWLAVVDQGDGHSVLETVSAPSITALQQLVITSNHTLRTVDFRRLAAITVAMDLIRTSLPDLSGFSALASCRWLTIDDDNNLRDLRGLSSLRELHFLFVENNAALTSVDGLEQIREMSGTVELRSNPALASTAGLRNVTSVGSLSVQIAPALTTLDLSSVQTVTGSLRLLSLPRVATLDGLRALTSIGENLSISTLPSLTTMSGLDALTTVHGSVNITGLPNVPDEEILAFLRRLRG